jgi:hypothetical protein
VTATSVATTDPLGWRTIKGPNWVYENAGQVKNDVLMQGVGALPETLRTPTRCPRCQNRKVTVQRGQDGTTTITCAKCDYQQLAMVGAAVGAFGLGVLLGLGITALLQGLARPASRKAAKPRNLWAPRLSAPRNSKLTRRTRMK